MGKFSLSTSLLIRAALRKGLFCTFLPEKAIEISNGESSYYFKGTSLPCNDAVAASLSANKYFLRRLLRDKNLPVPRTKQLRTPAAWESVLSSSLQFPLVVKPINASHANGATLNITDAEELERAVKRAFAYIRKHKKGDRVLVEEYFEGRDLRLFVVGGRVVSVVERDPAYVVGDGKSTIRQLIHAFNAEWRSPIKYDLPLCPIPIDSEVMRYLAKSKLTLNSVLPKDVKAYVRWNANVSTGGRAHDVTDEVHPYLKQLAVEVTKLSHLEVGGVDVLCKDIASPDMTTANISFLEVNDSPGFDIHYFPVTGEGRDVCAAVLDHIFEKTNQGHGRSADDVEEMLAELQAQALLVRTPMSSLSA